MKLNDWLKRRRELAGWTLRELGERLTTRSGRPLSEAYVHDLESGRRRIPPHILYQLAELFKMDPKWLEAGSTGNLESMRQYLREHPDDVWDMDELFGYALRTGSTVRWSEALELLQLSESAREAGGYRKLRPDVWKPGRKRSSHSSDDAEVEEKSTGHSKRGKPGNRLDSDGEEDPRR